MEGYDFLKKEVMLLDPCAAFCLALSLADTLSGNWKGNITEVANE